MFPPKPQTGFIQLILISQEGKDPFYLEIPMEIVTSVSLSPLKYLRYVGWCVLGVVGDLVDEAGDMVELNSEAVDQGVYQYNVPGENILAHAVDVEVIKQRSQVPSETTATREEFRNKLFKRDGCCVWTGVRKGVGMHIIPFSRGDEACLLHSYYHSQAKF
jgi:hypothetical protein